MTDSVVREACALTGLGLATAAAMGTSPPASTGRPCQPRRHPSRTALEERGRMPLRGDYEPSPREQVRDQVDRYVMSDGREGRTMRGRPVVVLTSRGAWSGKLRKTPLMRIEHGGRYALVASAGGAANNPSWYHNLLRNPIVDLQDGPVTLQWRAREISGDEKVEWWERADAAYPFYVVERASAGREIPILVLEPADAGAEILPPTE